MPRHRRYAPSGIVFHVINRGNDRRTLFYEAADYQNFLRLLGLAKERFKVRIFGVCVMPNHFHVLIMPLEDGALSGFLHWVQGCYARDLRALTHTLGNGHIFQQRFWSSPIEDSCHFLAVLRYIEANPVCGQLVAAAEMWPWSSLTLREAHAELLDELPMALPTEWSALVNEEPWPGQTD